MLMISILFSSLSFVIYSHSRNQKKKGPSLKIIPNRPHKQKNKNKNHKKLKKKLSHEILSQILA